MDECEFDAARFLDEELFELAAELARSSADLDADHDILRLLGRLHWNRYLALPEEADQYELWRSVELFRPLWDGNSQEVPEELHEFFAQEDQARGLSDRGVELSRRFERTGDLADLTEFVTLFRQAVDTVPDLSQSRPGYLSNLCAALHTLGMMIRDSEPLREARECGSQALREVAADDPHRVDIAVNLGAVLEALFSFDHDVQLVDEAIEMYRDAVEHATRPDARLELALAMALGFRHRLGGDLARLREAVSHARTAVALHPDDHLDRAVPRGFLGELLTTLFENTDDVEALDEAIATLRDVVRAIPRQHPERVKCLSSLGAALARRSERFDDARASTTAVTVFREALALVGPEDSRRAAHLGNLGTALLTRFNLFEDTSDLDEAMSVAEAGLALLAPDDPYRGQLIGTKGSALIQRFRRDGDIGALDQAAAAFRLAMAATPVDSPEYAARLSDLGNALQTRFGQVADRTALEQAVAVLRQAVAATPAGHPQRADHLSHLGAALTRWSVRFADLAMLDEGIEAHRQAVRSLPVRHPRRANFFGNLGNAFAMRFARLNDEATLDEAISAFQQAVDATPRGRAGRPTHLSNLGLGLAMRSRRRADQESLHEAIQVLREAMLATPPDHADRAHRSVSLGLALSIMYQLNPNPATYREAREHLSRGTAAPWIPTPTRAGVMGRVAELDLRTGNWDRALAMAENAVELVPRLVTRELIRSDREHNVVGVFGLAGTVAEAAIMAGKPDRAVELLEQTRGILLAETMDTRRDLTELRAHAPEQAAEFERIRDALAELDRGSSFSESTLLSGGLGAGQSDEIADHRAQDARRSELNRKWMSVLDSIHAIPRFRHFLAPPSIDQLRRQSVDGPIVYVLAQDRQGFALIVQDDESHPVRVVDLPELTDSAARKQVDLLRAARRTTFGSSTTTEEKTAAQQTIFGVLQWAWTTVAEPVLAALGWTDTPADGDPWPRLWWCPVGVMVSVPLHAAGLHRDSGSGRTVLDRAVSSYTSTIRTLWYSRAKAAAGPRSRPPSTLIVAVPDAPEHKPLSGVRAEADRIRALIPGAELVPSAGEKTDHRGVISALSRHHVAHFACHGIMDPANPANSRLLLHDHLDHPLTLAAISQLDMHDAELAYLSACDTSATVHRHADEVTHIATAFQIAGYHSVVGTFWPITDNTSTRVALEFYSAITADGTMPPDTRAAATALHHVVRRRRDDNASIPILWAAYVHVGI
jgi:tetratricopeptide (TPR) repeat protein